MNRRRPRDLTLAAHGVILLNFLAIPGCSIDSSKPLALARVPPASLESATPARKWIPSRPSFRARRIASKMSEGEARALGVGPVRIDGRPGFRRYAVAYALPRAVVAEQSTIPVALVPTVKPPEPPTLVAAPPQEPRIARPSLPRLRVRTTAYTHSEPDHLRYGKLTARGDRLKYGKRRSAAADWSRFPVGTEFRIMDQPGVTYVIDDYGSALTGTNTIDLYKPSEAAMNRWGVRRVNIEIIRWGSYGESLRIMQPRRQWPHVERMAAAIVDARRQPSAHLASVILH